jgi:hypothetical protein
MKGSFVHRVEERLDAEPVSCGEEMAVTLIPDRKRELASKPVNGTGATILEEVERDLGIRASAKYMAVALEYSTNAFEVVELAVRNDTKPVILTGNRLVTGLEIDDAQARVA